MKPLLITCFLSLCAVFACAQNATTKKIDSLVSLIEKADFPSIGSDSSYLSATSSARKKQTWYGDSLRNQVSRMISSYQQGTRKSIYTYYLFNSAIIRLDITQINNYSVSTHHIYYDSDKVIFRSRYTNEAETALEKGKEMLHDYYKMNYLDDVKMERQ